ncbi:MAG: ribonuclease T [Gammaproteobacteria bacterium]|nr:ribonuclease T [Gammaproteobacteria bacterium]
MNNPHALGEEQAKMMANRFRGFLPVVVDVETGGFNASTDALLEACAVMLRFNENGDLERHSSHMYHVEPFKGANIEQAALDVTGIKPDHPLRPAIPEDEAMRRLFREVRAEVKAHGCNRAVLVGHNSWFDLSFVNAAVERCNIKRNPFHPFSSFDTATLGGVAFGQTVLARAVDMADLGWDSNEAHSALYDAEKTADLFCNIVNRFKPMYESALQDRQGI